MKNINDIILKTIYKYDLSSSIDDMNKSLIINNDQFIFIVIENNNLVAYQYSLSILTDKIIQCESIGDFESISNIVDKFKTIKHLYLLSADFNIDNTCTLSNGQLFALYGSGNIPTNVSIIGPLAFIFSDISSISLSSNIKYIYQDGFGYNTSLYNIDLFNTEISNLESDCFSNCKNLESVILPQHLQSLTYNTFLCCDNLNYISCSNELTSIYDHVIVNCPNITDIIIPKSVKEINPYAFSLANNLTNIIIQNDEDIISSLAYLSIPNSQTRIKISYKIYDDYIKMFNTLSNEINVNHKYYFDKIAFNN